MVLYPELPSAGSRKVRTRQGSCDEPAGISDRELPVSVHRFRFWGALCRTSLFLLGGLMALVVGLGCLGGCLVSLAQSPLEAVLWGLFSVCGFIAFPAAVYEACRAFVQTPAVVFVYRTGLRWQKRGKETAVTWAEIARVERNVTVFVRGGREHRADATTIHFVSGKKMRIWAEVLSDYPTFADSVTYFHDIAKFEKSATGGSAARQTALRGPLDSGGGSGRHRFAVSRD